MALVAVAALYLAVPASGDAATTVRGTLAGGKGTTVLGLVRDGSAVADRVGGKGRFKLRFRGRSARQASLQLVTRAGSYRGPVVLARAGRRAYTTLARRKAKRVSLGRVRLRKGYATTARRTSKRLLRGGTVDRRRWARANRRGKPTGAGKLGLVRMRGRGAAARKGRPSAIVAGRAQAAGLANDPGADPDRDGTPNVADADDNGNLILDQTDPSTPEQEGVRGDIFSGLPLEPEQALNVNAAGVSRAQIDATLRERLNLAFTFFPRDPVGEDVLPGRTVTAVDVDCFALVYCRPGAGTAVVTSEGLAPGTPGAPAPGSLWTDYDPNGDGLPNLVLTDSVGGGPPGYHLVVEPRADTAQIRPGDSFNFVIRTDAAPATAPVTLTAYFVTTPAIDVYDDGTGPTPVSYPVQPGDPGTSENPAVLSSESVRLTWWRPQRPAIPGAEGGGFVDMGGLFYGVDVSVRVGEEERIVQCIAADWSAPSGTLTVGQVFPGPPSFESLTDSAADAPPDSANTLAATLDLGSCLRREGIDPAGKTVLARMIAADRARDQAAQFFHMTLPG